MVTKDLLDALRQEPRETIRCILTEMKNEMNNLYPGCIVYYVHPDLLLNDENLEDCYEVTDYGELITCRVKAFVEGG